MVELVVGGAKPLQKPRKFDFLPNALANGKILQNPKEKKKKPARRRGRREAKIARRTEFERERERKKKSGKEITIKEGICFQAFIF